MIHHNWFNQTVINSDVDQLWFPFRNKPPSTIKRQSQNSQKFAIHYPSYKNNFVTGLIFWS